MEPDRVALMTARTRRSACVASCGLLALVAVASAAGHGRIADSLAARTAGAVVLGSQGFAPRGAGWGNAHPSRIFNGGDPSGLVTHIHWTRWGDSLAIGRGLSSIYEPRGGYYPQLVTIELHASNLGHCTASGPLAYRRLSIRVPSHPGGKLGPWMLWSGASTICSAGLTSTPSARPVTGATASRYQRVYVANKDCRGHTFRPEKITLACGDGNLYATEVHFFKGTSEVYGSPKADASATIHQNDCKPDCASGKFFSDKGALILKRIVRCRDGRLYYSRAEYAFPEGQNVVDIEPSERCSVVRTARKASHPQGRARVGAVAQSEAPVSLSARAVIAARSADAALKLAALGKGATRLRGGVPAGERKLLGSVRTPAEVLGSEEQAKLVQRSAIWVTSTPPAKLFAYLTSRLPRGTRMELSSSGDVSFTPPNGHETLPEIEKREAVNYWSEEFRLPTDSSVLRLRAVGVYIARAAAGRFVVRVNAAASWERPRPSYSLLGTSVHSVTITASYQPAGPNEPAPVIINDSTLVHAIAEAVNDLPVDEALGGVAKSCPAERVGEKHRVLFLTFSEQEQGPVLATFEDDPSACEPTPSITVPGHPPVALSEARDLIPKIEKTIGSTAAI